MKRLAGKPFALVGVNADPDRSRIPEQKKKHQINWRSFWNGSKGPRGPISTAWQVRGWPTAYVIDHRGVVRHKNVYGEDLDKAVEDLLAKVGKRKNVVTL